MDYYHTIGHEEGERLEALNTLTDSLFRLTDATNHLNSISSDLTNPMEDERDIPFSSPRRDSVVSVSHSDSEKPITKKKKRVTDPNAPKKPLTVFFAYSAYIRQHIRDERAATGLPPLSSTEITQEISKKWKTLPDSEKEKWKKAYHTELEHYQIEKQKYLEAKANGTLGDSKFDSPTHAPVPNPFGKRSHEDDGEKKKKKKKKTKKEKKSKSD